MIEPVPCKLCGNPAAVNRFKRELPHRFTVKCTSCKGLHVETASRGKEEEAVATWNVAMGAADG